MPGFLTEHEQAINKFIPEAVRLTKKEIKPEKYSNIDKYSDEWNKVYFAYMNKFTIEAGLRIP